MSYEVLARKWRPQRFSELVGQEHISRTLKNAIAHKRVAHAYLFVGSRGVGKTTSARLFAKSLNCTDLQEGEPCCKCESCLSIANGNSLDVIEIDGASNNGVDHIRDLRENVQYTPSAGNYKIYIIDEVHMLSSAAWNALLKTLEEPPPHVKFIFATTESHKVLPTVVSRCQRFDFKSIPPLLISRKLREIATAEKIFIDDSALAAIARAADGGMRDAQSIFDQMIAFCGGGNESETIREQDVIDVFGMASTTDIAGIIEAMFQDDVSAMLLTLHRLAGEGRDLERLFSDILVFLRNLMVVQYCKDFDSILEIDEMELQQLSSLKAFPATMTRSIIDLLMSVEGRLRSALNKRVFLEVNLIRAMKEAHAVNINDIIAGFTHLKNSELPRQTIVEKTVVVEKVLENKDSVKKNVEVESTLAEPLTSEPVAQSPALEALNTLKEEVQRLEISEPVNTESEVYNPEAEIPTPENFEPLIIEEEAVSAEVAIEIQHEAVTEAIPPVTKPSYDSIPPLADEVHTEPVEYIHEALPQCTPTTPAEIWHEVISKIEMLPNGAVLAHLMKEMKPLSFEHGVFLADFTDDFAESHRINVRQPIHLEMITNTLNLVTGVPNVSFQCSVEEERFVNSDTVRLEPSPVVKKRVQENELVKYITQVFHGELVDVRG